MVSAWDEAELDEVCSAYRAAVQRQRRDRVIHGLARVVSNDHHDYARDRGREGVAEAHDPDWLSIERLYGRGGDHRPDVCPTDEGVRLGYLRGAAAQQQDSEQD